MQTRVEVKPTPFMSALKNKDFNTAYKLLKEGADLITEKDTCGLTGLHYAAMFAPKALMEQVIQKLQTAEQKKPFDPAALDPLDKFNWTPLAWAIFNSNYSAAELLVEARVNVNRICNNSTYLNQLFSRYSISDEATQLIETLITAGADVNLVPWPSDVTYTPLMAASNQHNLKLCYMLLMAGADVDKTIIFKNKTALAGALDNLYEKIRHGQSVKQAVQVIMLLSAWGANIPPIRKSSDNNFNNAMQQLVIRMKTLNYQRSCFHLGYLQAIANYTEQLYLKQTNDVAMVNYANLIQLIKENENIFKECASTLLEWNRKKISNSIAEAKDEQAPKDEILLDYLYEGLMVYLTLYFSKKRDEKFFAPYVNQVLFQQGLLQEAECVTPNLPGSVWMIMMNMNHIQPLPFSDDPKNLFSQMNVSQTENFILNTRKAAVLDCVAKWKEENTNNADKKDEDNSPTISFQPVTQTSHQENKSENKQCEYARLYYYLKGQAVGDAPCDHVGDSTSCDRCKQVAPFFLRTDWTREIPAKERYLFDMHEDYSNMPRFPLPDGSCLTVFQTPLNASMNPWGSCPPVFLDTYKWMSSKGDSAIRLHNCSNCNQMELKTNSSHQRDFCSKHAGEYSLHHETKSVSRLFPIKTPPVPNRFYFSINQFPAFFKLPADILRRSERDIKGNEVTRILQSHELKLFLDDEKAEFVIRENTPFLILRAFPFLKFSLFDPLFLNMSAYLLKTEELIYRSLIGLYSRPPQPEDIKEIEDEMRELDDGPARSKHHPVSILALKLLIPLQEILMEVSDNYLTGKFIDAIERHRLNETFILIMSRKSVTELQKFYAEMLVFFSNYYLEKCSQCSNKFDYTQGLLQLLDIAHSLGDLGEAILIKLLKRSFTLFFQGNDQVTLYFKRQQPEDNISLVITLTSFGKARIASLNSTIIDYLGEVQDQSQLNTALESVFSSDDAEFFTIMQTQGEILDAKQLTDHYNRCYQPIYNDPILLKVLNDSIQLKAEAKAENKQSDQKPSSVGMFANSSSKPANSGTVPDSKHDGPQGPM